MELPPRPDLPREIEQPELLVEAAINVVLGVNTEGNRVVIVALPENQTADAVTLIGMLGRAAFIIQTQMTGPE